jgi:hypothetical protein
MDGLRLIESLSESERDRIGDFLNRLLSNNILVKEKDRDAYQFIRRNREAVQAFFRFLKWDFVLDERHDCVFVQGPDSHLRRSLNREETLWMLVIRLIYQEKRESLSISEYPMTTLHEIRSKYETFRIPWLNATALDRLVRLCARYQLMEALDPDLRSDDCRFRLFHSWIHVIDMDELRAITERIESYGSGRGEDLFDEVDAQTPID